MSLFALLVCNPLFALTLCYTSGEGETSKCFLHGGEESWEELQLAFLVEMIKEGDLKERLPRSLKGLVIYFSRVKANMVLKASKTRSGACGRDKNPFKKRVIGGNLDAEGLLSKCCMCMFRFN